MCGLEFLEVLLELLEFVESILVETYSVEAERICTTVLQMGDIRWPVCELYRKAPVVAESYVLLADAAVAGRKTDVAEPRVGLAATQRSLVAVAEVDDSGFHFG